MSASPRETSHTLLLSVRIYRRLLVAYPQPFRREYGEHMTQVFRDCCREAAATKGIAGLLRYWLIATSDLIVNALEEHRQKELAMTRTRWIRLGSLAAIIGGAIATLFAGLGLTITIAQLLDENSPLGLALFPVHIVSWGAPALALFFVLALIGLQARGASQAGVIGWISITLAIIGMVISGLGNGLTSGVMYSQADACGGPLNCNFYDPNGYARMGYMVGLLGSVIFAIGMVVYGIVAQRRRILPRGNWLLLVVGVMPFLTVAASVIAMLASGGSDYAGTQKVAIMLGVPVLTFAILWILLGVAMRPRGSEDAAAQNISAPVNPAV
jgi:hypothetical protein